MGSAAAEVGIEWGIGMDLKMHLLRCRGSAWVCRWASRRLMLIQGTIIRRGGMVFAAPLLLLLLLLPPSTFTPSAPPSTAMSAMLVLVLEAWDFICCSHYCCCACVCGGWGWGCASCISSSLSRFDSISSFSRSFSRIAAADFPLPRFFAPAPFFFLVSTGGWVAGCAEPSPFVVPLDGALKSKDAISTPTRNTDC